MSASLRPLLTAVASSRKNCSSWCLSRRAEPGTWIDGGADVADVPEPPPPMELCTAGPGVAAPPYWISCCFRGLVRCAFRDATRRAPGTFRFLVAAVAAAAVLASCSPLVS